MEYTLTKRLLFSLSCVAQASFSGVNAMKTPLQHIENQLCEVNQLSDKENKRWAEGVLQGLCEAYFNMGLINQKEWDEVWQRADINYRLSIDSSPSSTDNDWQLIFG